MKIKAKDTITFADGTYLSIGDTFFYVSPEYHDGTVTECLVDSFWPGDSIYGDRIRFTTNETSMWQFVYKQFFERENPTCFLSFTDAENAAAEQRYTREA